MYSRNSVCVYTYNSKMAAPAIAEISSREQLLFLKSRVTLRGLRFFINFDLLLKQSSRYTRRVDHRRR